jgi:hypothetical protein
MKINYSQVLRSAAICVAICIGAYFLAAGTLRVYAIYHPAASLSSIASCFARSSDPNFTSDCLDTTIQNLLKTHTTQELMNYVVASTTPSVVVNDCHPIGHVVGEMTYKKYGSMEQALSQCSNNCRSACTHGVIGEGVLEQMGEGYSDDDIAHADKAKFEKLATWYCGQSTTICHAIGHLAYIITQNDAGALGVCDTASSNAWYRENCYQGVFMERAGTFINELFPTGADKVPSVQQNSYTYPCTDLPEQYHSACFLFLIAYQEPLFAKDGLTTPQEKLQKETQVCESLSGMDRADCFTGIGASTMTIGFSNLNAPSTQLLCNVFPAETDRSACSLGVLSQFLYTNVSDMYTYCENINEEGRRALCYDAAFEWIESRKSVTNDPAAVCATDQTCIARYNVFMKERSDIPDYRFGLSGD